MSSDWGKLKYTNLMDFITPIKKKQYTNLWTKQNAYGEKLYEKVE